MRDSAKREECSEAESRSARARDSAKREERSEAESRSARARDADQNPWQTLGSRVVYTNDWFVLREDTVIRPDGREGKYGVVEMRPSVGILAIRDDDHLAIVSQWRYVHSKMSLEIPTGGSEEGESMREAAERELREETGLRADRWTSLGTIDNSNGTTTDVSHIFLAQDLQAGPMEQQGDERIDLVWMPFEEVVKSVMTGAITESVSVAGVLKVKLLRMGEA